MNEFMKAAIDQAAMNIDGCDGGPFGAAIVQNGRIIAVSRNQVLITKDPTMHAEVSVIRKACEMLGRYDLSDCELYTTCEPCIMCLGAIYWARIPKIYYGAGKEDAAKVGFDDERFYNSILQGTSIMESEQTDYGECLELFLKWDEKDDKTLY